MSPTRRVSLLGLTVVVAALSWVVTAAAYARLPALPWLAPFTLVLLAIALAYQARAVRVRLAGRPGTRPIDPLAVARSAVLAKASAYAGAAVAGIYVGVLAYLAGLLDKSQPRADAFVAAAGLLAAVAVVEAALALERACKLPDPPMSRLE